MASYKSEPTTRLNTAFAERSTAVIPWRWAAVSVFILANVLNFLDRQLLAAIGPTLKSEFHLSNAKFGSLVSAFSLVYAAMTPFAGLFIDKVGLGIGTLTAVGEWSFVSVCTAFVSSFRGLLVCRAALGAGEAGALPLLSKANASYLSPSEWGLASAVGTVAITLGSVMAPLMVASLSPRYGWRSVFVVCGALGLVWIILWSLTARRLRPPAASEQQGAAPTAAAIWRDRRLWCVAIAYALVLSVLILWLNWTTIYLVQTHHLTESIANRYFAWIPPLFAAGGGFLSGGVAFAWIRRGMTGLAARTRLCTWCMPFFLVSAAIPFLSSVNLSIVAIGVSLFVCQTAIGSLGIIPIDLFGAARAGFSISILGCSYALMQAFASPLIGASIDKFGFSAVCVAAAALPIVGIIILRAAAK